YGRRTGSVVSGCFFFFQAEAGIRDWSVTGVQTCALPISGRRCARRERACALIARGRAGPRTPARFQATAARPPPPPSHPARSAEIGRASCRERVEISVGAGPEKERTNQRREARDACWDKV